MPNQINYLLSTKVNTTSSKILPVLPPPIGTQTIKNKPISLIISLHFFVCLVAGHAGKLVFGKLGSQVVVCLQGRFHFYEGHSIHKVRSFDTPFVGPVKSSNFGLLRFCGFENVLIILFHGWRTGRGHFRQW